jgi:uncharacterized protein YebE (UPF0316 family)
MSIEMLLTGLGVFFARIIDVSIGTVRTIATVQGRTKLSFFLALIEITIWISVISVVINNVRESPFLTVFYAFGFATGNVVGIKVERKMAIGALILRVLTRTAGAEITEELRAQGQRVTVFHGEGKRGPVTELYIVCRRRDLRKIISLVEQKDPEAFYITEQARDVSKVLRPALQKSPTGWRAVFKKK